MCIDTKVSSNKEGVSNKIMKLDKDSLPNLFLVTTCRYHSFNLIMVSLYECTLVIVVSKIESLSNYFALNILHRNYIK